MSPAGDRLDGTERRKPAVMSDVAALAGVSHQTVSRVINGSTHVRARDARARAGAMREARLPAERGRARAGHRALPHARRRHASTPRCTARPRRCSGSSAPPTPPATSSASSACESLDRAAVLEAVERLRALGGRRHPRRSRRRWPSTRRAAGTCRATCRSWPSRPGPRTAVPRRRGRPVRRARGWPPSTCSTSATATVHHLAGPADWLEAQRPHRRLARRAGRRGRRAPRAAARRLERRARATSSARRAGSSSRT